MIKELEPLLKIDAVSRWSGLSVNSLQNRAFRKKIGIPIVKMGRELRADPIKLKKWLDELHG